MSRIVRTRNTKLREGTINTVTGTLADFGYERTPGWAGRVQKRVFRILELGNWGEHKIRFLGVLGWVWGVVFCWLHMDILVVGGCLKLER